MIAFRRFELIPTLFFVAAFTVLCALGSWQLARLHWKKWLMDEAASAQAQPTLAALPEEMDSLTYRNVALTGKLLYDHTFHLIGRQQGMDVGYYMLTPMVLDDDGRIILVNRGFSPPGKESKPEGLVTVHGMLRPVREKRLLVPENVPEKNIWTHEDLDAIGKLIGKKPLPLVVEAVGSMEKDVFPIPNDGKIVFRNDHLGYAITWYALAVVSVVMFGAYYRKKP